MLLLGRLLLVAELFQLDALYSLLLGLCRVLGVNERLVLLLAHGGDCAGIRRFIFHLKVIGFVEVQVIVVVRRNLRDVHS